MGSSEFTKEHLNYFRICYITTNLIPDCLRTAFKQEWDSRHKIALGEWKDTPQNGLDFYNGESPMNRKKNARLLSTMINGNRSEWDCTMLFYAILYSDSIYRINPVVQANVDDLRRFRNEYFAHIPQGSLTDKEFQIAVHKVVVAFKNLHVDDKPIQDTIKRKSFHKQELEIILRKVCDLKDELEVSEKTRYLTVSLFSTALFFGVLAVVVFSLPPVETSFAVLPPSPSHAVINRTNEVSEIVEQLHRLRDGNSGKLTALYISGNPGSGKSQLARQVGELLYNEKRSDPGALSFIMTLNAEKIETLLDTYILFARRLQCSEYSISVTIAARDMETEEKIKYIRSLVSVKVQSSPRWLILIDNVANISSTLDLLPQQGSNEWLGGQLLVTTQDTSSIPTLSSSVSHFSISKGMAEEEAIKLLTTITGNSSNGEMESITAKALDYQPLALASAAVYVKQVRKSKQFPHFSWENFISKLEEGKRRLIEDSFARSNPNYSKSMLAATDLAVQSVLESDSIFKYAFQFLSFCSYQPLQLEMVINHVLTLDTKQDRELVGIRIKSCSLLLFEDQEYEGSVRLHQVVHQAIKTTFDRNNEGRHPFVAYAVVTSIIQCVRQTLPQTSYNDRFYIDSQKFVPHLKALIVSVKRRFPTVETFYLKETEQNLNISQAFRVFGLICHCHSHFQQAKDFVEAAHQLLVDKKEHNDSIVVNGTHYLGTYRDLAAAYSYLGRVHSGLGELQQALQCHEKSLSILISHLGPEHLNTAPCYSNLGEVYYGLGNYRMAKQYHEHELAILKNHHVSENHTQFKYEDTFSNLGKVHLALGNLQQAKQFFHQSLDIFEKRSGDEESVRVAATHSSLGEVYRALDHLKQAKQHQEKALEIRLRLLGQRHDKVATSHNNLGLVYWAERNVTGAMYHHEQALSIWKEVLGPQHDKVAISHNNLGEVHRALKNMQKAKEHYEQAIAIRMNIARQDRKGHLHPDVAVSFNNLGLVYVALENLQGAKECYEYALSIWQKELGDGHINVATCFSNLADLYTTSGDLQHAKMYHEKALPIYQQRLGNTHNRVLQTYSKLIAICLKLHELQQATFYTKQAQRNFGLREDGAAPVKEEG